MAERTAQQIGHETRDLNVRAVAWFAIGLVACAIIIDVALIGIYPLFARRHPSPSPPSRVALQPHLVAPAPRLQTNPSADLDGFRAAEEKKLNSYGWVDKQRNLARIPVERAMELIVQRGLPARGSGTPDSSGKTPEQMRQEKAPSAAPPEVRGEK